jgi:membrane protein required for colicin V production
VSLLDLLVAIIIGASVAAGFVAGFARVGIGFIAAILGVVFGFWFYGIPAGWMHHYLKSTTASNLIGFLLVFWMFLLAGALLAKLCSKFFRWTGLSWLDRLLGGAFGLVRGAVIAVAIIAVVLAFTPKPMPNWMVQSQVLPYAMEASSAISALAPNTIKNAFRESMYELRRLWDEQFRKSREELRALKRGASKSAPEKDARPPEKNHKDKPR